MNWTARRKAARERYVAKYDEPEAAAYDRLVGDLTAEDERAYLDDLRRVFDFQVGMDYHYPPVSR